MIHSCLKSVIILFLGLSLFACGGGGSDTATQATTNKSPVISGTPSQAQEGKAFTFTPNISDPDGDTLSLSITNKPDWLEFNLQTGTLSGTPAAKDVGLNQGIIIKVSDGSLLANLAFDIQVEFLPIEEALRTGKASLVEHAEEYLNAILDSIEQNRTLFQDAKAEIFSLTEQGEVNADSLTNISWNPTHDASLFTSSFGHNEALLITNDVTDINYDIKNMNIGVIGVKDSSLQQQGRYILLGSNPMRNHARDPESVNQQMQQFLENSVQWLTDRDDLKSEKFNLVIAQMGQSYYFPDQVATRQWFDKHYSESVNYNSAKSCNGNKLASCINEDTDLLVISQYAYQGDDIDQVGKAVAQAIDEGIAVLYMHHDGNKAALGKLLFPLFNVEYAGDNYWRKLKLSDFNSQQSFAELPKEVVKVKALINHFIKDSFSFNLNSCDDKSCPEDSSYYTEFDQAANIIQKIVNSYDSEKINIFSSMDFRYQKLLILLADFYRQTVVYPMDKNQTPRIQFLHSLYADHAIYNYRLTNPGQMDMGNFSRSDFSHIKATDKLVKVLSKPPFRAAGVYALPGQTFKVTRLDSNQLVTEIFINTLRSGATHQFEDGGYKRPRFLRSTNIKVTSGETIQITSPYGGPVQISFDRKDVEAEILFENVGKHPFWSSSEDNQSFSQGLEASEYDWAELVTPSFEVHSKVNKMKESIEESQWTDAADLAAATSRYMHNFPHQLAGFKGPGITSAPEVDNFAAHNNLQLDTLDKVKHMNADQATCGYGCSGNPYDAYWAYGPTNHGDLHELGHGLEKSRFRFVGWEGHASTNPYSYFSKTQFYLDTGKAPSCQNLPFEDLFGRLQQSKKQSDPFAYMQQQNLTSWSQGVAIYIQLMMSVQADGAIQNGWFLLARLHLLEREFNRAVKGQETWLAKRNGLGFAGLSEQQAIAFNNNDWLLISLSHASGRDLISYLTMWGLPFSEQAKNQVKSFNYKELEQRFFISGSSDYCLGLNKSWLAVDGNQVWP